MSREKLQSAVFIPLTYALGLVLSTGLGAETVTLVAVQDAFVREQSPTLNYGGSGNLCVAGTDSVNGVGEPRGRFDTVVEFDAAPAVAAFDTAFGAGNWTITGVVLRVMEVGNPSNPIFPIGVGDFRVNWLSDDSWEEGTGMPMMPVVGTGNQMTWLLLQAILASAAETPLGTFSNTGNSGFREYGLALEENLVGDVAAGGLVSFHILPLTTRLGFSFNSHNQSVPENRVRLLITAEVVIFGDLNCDDVVDVDDVEPFVLALLDPAAYATAYPGCRIVRADMNDDGFVNGADVAGFTAELLP